MYAASGGSTYGAARYLPTDERHPIDPISPYAVRLLVQERDTSGRHAGQLYFVSTFGSAAGTLLTSFYLVLLFDVNQNLIGLAGISCVMGATALWGGRGR